MVVAIAAMTLFSGCQSAINAVAVLQEAVKGMNSVESIEPFIDGGTFFGNVGDKVYWRNTNETDHFPATAENYIRFVLGEKKIAAEGNIMSLIDSSCKSVTIPSEYCFAWLFGVC